MAKLKGLSAKVEPHHRYKTPHQIYDVKTQASGKSPRKIADAKRSTTPEDKQLSDGEARALAIEAAAPAKGDAVRVVCSELCYYKCNGVPTLSWKVIVKTTPPKSDAKKRRPAEWKMYIDA